MSTDPVPYPATHIAIADPQYPESWRCLCGNLAESHGFYPCTPEGVECEPTEADWPEPHLYRCANCGLLVGPDRTIHGRKAPNLTVAVCLMDRCYGGPEEGGWYYTAYDPDDPEVAEFASLRRTFDRWDDAITYSNELMEDERLERVNTGRPPVSSVRSRGKIVAHVFDGPVQVNGRPHYE